MADMRAKNNPAALAFLIVRKVCDARFQSTAVNGYYYLQKESFINKQ
jgi:hypothetical protein